MTNLTLKQAAPYIGASAYKLREMVREKQIPAYRIGNRIMFRKEALDKWIASQESENCSNLQ